MTYLPPDLLTRHQPVEYPTARGQQYLAYFAITPSLPLAKSLHSDLTSRGLPHSPFQEFQSHQFALSDQVERIEIRLCYRHLLDSAHFEERPPMFVSLLEYFPTTAVVTLPTSQLECFHILGQDDPERKILFETASALACSVIVRCHAVVALFLLHVD